MRIAFYLCWLVFTLVALATSARAEDPEQLEQELREEIRRLHPDPALVDFTLAQWRALEVVWRRHLFARDGGPLEALFAGLDAPLDEVPVRFRTAGDHAHQLARRYFTRLHLGHVLHGELRFGDLRNLYERTWTFREVAPLLVRRGRRDADAPRFRFWIGEMFALRVPDEEIKEAFDEYGRRFQKTGAELVTALTEDLTQWVNRKRFQGEQIVRVRVYRERLARWVHAPELKERLEQLGRLLACEF